MPPAHATERGYLATFYADGFWCGTYVDITTPARWDTGHDVPVLRCTDLDLDVVRTQDGRVYVDDEDEFADHRVAFGYPDDVVALAEESCRWVLERVRDRIEPFGEVGDAWMDRARLL